ncbi:hypothetical protein Bxe_C0675 [Paraburkholderia xenovorans LB400]|uniref:Uncharacterized protein n=1 Tax=Paraburkholderia xenovorans (strain LB400) TaxID=266265 RepID=Q13H66_PARXL|nr:hypothetical protein Bxe_C0675 [Paraburkholderia xenovorans LB400]
MHREPRGVVSLGLLHSVHTIGNQSNQQQRIYQVALRCGECFVVVCGCVDGDSWQALQPAPSLPCSNDFSKHRQLSRGAACVCVRLFLTFLRVP